MTSRQGTEEELNGQRGRGTAVGRSGPLRGRRASRLLLSQFAKEARSACVVFTMNDPAPRIQDTGSQQAWLRSTITTT